MRSPALGMSVCNEVHCVRIQIIALEALDFLHFSFSCVATPSQAGTR